MDLFFIERHGFSESTSDEQSKLDAVLKKIEANKRIGKKRKREVTEERDDNQPQISKLPKTTTNEEVTQENVTTPKPTVSKKVTTAEPIGFTVLGKSSSESRPAVKRVLPKWLSKPSVISSDLDNLSVKVSDIKLLDRGLRKLLKSNGIKRLFPVQSVVIPYILKTHKHSDVIIPRDVCVSSPTGSGKTLAFVLPIVQILKEFTVKRVRALVILPTQDLAHQVYTSFKKYTQNTHLAVTLVTGKSPFIQEQKQLIAQRFGYTSKVDIIVCTPGRLVDHLKSTEGFDLRHLEFLIIDEADRVLNSMQNDWLYHLEKHINQLDSANPAPKVLNVYSLNKHRGMRKLLFSATLSQDPEKLQKLSIFQPKLFTSVMPDDQGADISNNTNSFIGKYTTPRELTEKYMVCSAEVKPLVLYKFITKESLSQILVFTHSVESVHRLSILLKALSNNALRVEEISSHLPANSRNELINRFAKTEIDVLICTDALARGMDLPKVKCVISYNMPKYIKTYIHRVGRTARAGEHGLAVTMLQDNQVSHFHSLLSQANKANIEEVKISEEELEPLGDSYREALENLKQAIVKENKQNLKKIKHMKSKVKHDKTTN